MSKSEYYTILTKIGIAKFIAARVSGNGVNIKSFKLSSKIILPSEEMQSLDEIVYEANINSKTIDEKNPNYVNLMCHVPSDVGGFEINVIGIYDEEGDLLAVGNLPRTYKPILQEGSAKELMIKIVMELSNASEVILKLDPSVIMASRDYVDAIKIELDLKIENFINNYEDKLQKILKEYVDLKTDQDIKGIKNFLNLPTSNLKAHQENQLINLATLKKEISKRPDVFGYGKKYYDETKNRQSGVRYTNWTNSAIFVTARTKLTQGAYFENEKTTYFVDEILVQNSYHDQMQVCFIVPPGSTYHFHGAVYHFIELK